VKFRDAMMRKLNDQYSRMVAFYHETSAKIERDILMTVRSYVPLMEQLQILISELDVFTSLAFVANNSPGSPFIRPEIVEDEICLVQSRHPVLEQVPDLQFIPNDVELKRGKGRTV